MKIDTTDIGVFSVTVPYDEAHDWLVDPGADLVEVNSAIDEAVSFAADNIKAYVVIEISAGRPK